MVREDGLDNTSREKKAECLSSYGITTVKLKVPLHYTIPPTTRKGAKKKYTLTQMPTTHLCQIINTSGIYGFVA